jgi:hypothetical protein
MNILWKIKRKVRRTLIAHSHNPHPSSYPYISGDTFRSKADHIYEFGNTTSLKPGSVAPNDIIFVQADILDEYFTKIHPLINNPYKLITQNGDRNITEKELLYIDEKIIHWFAQNILVTHPKVTPIPIGLENAYYANAGYLPLYTKPLPSRDTRSPHILVGFNVASNSSQRKIALEILSHNANADIINKRYSQDDYVSVVRKYCFVASPPGNGDDCIRSWESMLLGAVPIVKRSVGIEYFESLHLPIFIVDSWDDLANLSEYDLNVKYDLIMSRADRRPLSIDYWWNIIKNK